MTTQNILLNSSNIVPNTKNTRLIYNFPTPQVFDNSLIAIHSLQMYYSWFNINATLYNNNTFRYRWWDTSGNLSNVQMTLPNGYYSVAALNLYLQNEMIKNGHYLKNSAGKDIFFIELIENPSYYSVQLNLYPMYSSLPSGWTKMGTWKFPTTQQTPSFAVFATTNFKDVIGFNSGTYPATTTSTLYKKTSDYTPQLSPISALLVRCNIAQNNNTLPNDVIYNFTSGSTSFGGLIVEKPSELYYSNVVNGTFNKLELSFCDQNFNTVEIIDPNLLLTLIIKHN